jgi:hypothetical protein
MEDDNVRKVMMAMSKQQDKTARLARSWKTKDHASPKKTGFMLDAAWVQHFGFLSFCLLQAWNLR